VCLLHQRSTAATACQCIRTQAECLLRPPSHCISPVALLLLQMSQSSTGLTSTLPADGLWAVSLMLDASTEAAAAGCPRLQLLQLVAVDTSPPELAWTQLAAPNEAALLESAGHTQQLHSTQSREERSGKHSMNPDAAGSSSSGSRGGASSGATGTRDDEEAPLAGACHTVLALHWSKPIKKLLPTVIRYRRCSLVSLTCSGPQNCVMRVAGGGTQACRCMSASSVTCTGDIIAFACCIVAHFCALLLS
jgi:hypothetical protein